MQAQKTPWWKRWSRAVWDGPFYIGPLTSPASVGDVLLKILETVWRGLVAIVVFSLSAIAAVLCWVEYIEPTLFPPLGSKIEVAVRYDDGSSPTPITIGPSEGPTASNGEVFRCNPQYPLLVRFTNRSTTVVGNISFDIEAYQFGRADPVSPYSFIRESNQIIRPGYWFENCWAAPELPSGSDASTLIYRAKIYGATEVDPALANRLAPYIPPPASARPPVAPQAQEPNWRAKIGGGFLAIVFILAVFAGAISLVGIITILGPGPMRRWIAKNEGWAIVLAAVANSLLLWKLADLVMPLDPIGSWIAEADRWSRTHGYADAASVGLFAIASLWTIPLLLFLNGRVARSDQIA